MIRKIRVPLCSKVRNLFVEQSAPSQFPDKTDYQAGTFTFGALGIDFDSDLSISINLPDWEAVYGKDTMP